MAGSKHFLNGKIVEEKDFLISPRDLGFARGYGVFDFFITYPSRRPFMLEKHIDRLFNSAKLIDLAMPWTKEEILQRVHETIEANGEGEKMIKVIVTGGVSTSLMPQGNPTLIVMVDPLTKFPEEHYTKGVGMILVPFMRYQPKAKTTNYLEGVRQVQRGQAKRAVEPIYYDDTQIFEGASCNIFAVIDGTLMTTKSNILPGITREVILESLKLPVKVEVRDFTKDELLAASEAFITSSNREVMPVVRLDDKLVGDGAVGKITKEVMRAFQEFTRSDAW